jgi:hypothetical protein
LLRLDTRVIIENKSSVRALRRSVCLFVVLMNDPRERFDELAFVFNTSVDYRRFPVSKGGSGVRDSDGDIRKIRRDPR